MRTAHRRHRAPLGAAERPDDGVGVQASAPPGCPHEALGSPRRHPPRAEPRRVCFVGWRQHDDRGCHGRRRCSAPAAPLAQSQSSGSCRRSRHTSSSSVRLPAHFSVDLGTRAPAITNLLIDHNSSAGRVHCPVKWRLVNVARLGVAPAFIEHSSSHAASRACSGGCSVPCHSMLCTGCAAIATLRATVCSRCFGAL